MSIFTSDYPFVFTDATRTWEGIVTWTRDLATQVVEITITADRTAGTSTSGFYVYWNPARDVELRPRDEVYPSVGSISFAIQEDGMGYVYVGGSQLHREASFQYVTGAPIQDEELPPTGDLLADLNAIVAQVGVPVYPGYAPSGVALPYIVTRPIDIGIDDDMAVNGDIVDWNLQLGVYCVAAGVQASFNLALAVMGLAQGARMRGTTLAASMGYNGAEIEGNYESQVTIQLNQGALA